MSCHGILYFLKSLRSLEEFRKNPHVKIPPNYTCANFQSLGKFKNLIFNSEILFSSLSAQPTLRPTRPSAQPAPAGLSSPAPETLPTEFPCPLRATAVARLPRHRPSSGEARAELPVVLSLFCTPAGELSCSGERAATLRHPGPMPSLVHGGPSAPSRFTTRGPGPHLYPLENNSLNQYFWEFCKEAPVFLCNQLVVHDFAVRSQNLKNIYKKVPSLRNILKNSSKT
jgi:hypothetical protein